MLTTRLAAAMLLVTYASACTSYRVLADPSSELVAAPTPVKEVRVTLRSGERIALDFPMVVGDSLRGTLHGGTARSVSLHDVAGVEVRKPSTAKTVALVFAITGVVGAVIAAGLCDASDCTD